MRLAFGILATVALLAIGYYVYTAAIGNPRIARKILEEPDGELARKVMLLTLPSGKRYPVNYLRDGDLVFAGCDGRWWRELRGDGAPVSVHIRGRDLRGIARVVTDDPGYRERIFERLRPRSYRWIGGKLIEIRLEAEEP